MKEAVKMAKSRKSMKDRTKKRAQGRESSGGGYKFNLPEKAEFLKIKKGTLKESSLYTVEQCLAYLDYDGDFVIRP